MVPIYPQDEEALRRLATLAALTQSQSPLPALFERADGGAQPASIERVSAYVEDVNDAVDSVLPRLRQLLASPGVGQFASDVAVGVAERVLARSVLAAFGASGQARRAAPAQRQ